ncbi:MAG: NAD(P)/FAD-dependent oxidoreductase [Chitinophagales bacterium]|nr:NAD(P)/FAD-dependent oxidoreductase [Chitinophagales bacterium]
MSTYNTDILIIGTGFGGICMGIKLKEANNNNFIMLERDPELGGTWYANTYPGAECDVHSHLYQYSFEPNPNWKKMFGTQEEILEYTNHCVDKYNLRPNVHLSAEVNHAQYNEEDGTWTLKTKQGKTYHANKVIIAGGGLSRIAFPDIKGINSFKGEKFHSAQWNHDYDYSNKRVAIIGSGASAIQIVPAIAKKVKSLSVFQRTPSWVIPKPDREISTVEKTLFKYLPITQQLYRNALFVRNELFATGFVIDQRVMKLVQPQVEKYIKKVVKDKSLQEKVTPNYTLGCKRILLSNDYYPALNRDNVEVVTEGIDAITSKGIKTKDGKQHEFDLIVFATGFKASEDVAPFPIIGKNGNNLKEIWDEKGAEAYLGVSIAGFPNAFMVIGPNTGLGHSSMILMIEHSVHYIIEALKTYNNKKVKSIDVKQKVQDDYNAAIQKRLNKAVWSQGGCASWYKTKDGKNTTLWPGFTFEFRARTLFFDSSKYNVEYVQPKVVSKKNVKKDIVLN